MSPNILTFVFLLPEIFVTSNHKMSKNMKQARVILKMCIKD